MESKLPELKKPEEREQFLADNIPTKLEDVTEEWLSNLVGIKIVSFESKILEMGVMSDAAIIKPNYEEGVTGGPVSFVLKYAKGNDMIKMIAASGAAYIKEVNFYS